MKSNKVSQNSHSHNSSRTNKYHKNKPHFNTNRHIHTKTSHSNHNNIQSSTSTQKSLHKYTQPHSISQRNWGWPKESHSPVPWPKNKPETPEWGWTPKPISKKNVFFRISKGNRELGVIEFKLFDSIVPKTAHNFRQLCVGSKKVGDVKLHFKGSKFHRIIKGFMIQGGDITHFNGTCGCSIYGRHFPDESFDLKHDRPFLLACANRGPNSNNSGFYITTVPCPWLDGRNVVFGEVIFGHDVVREIEYSPTNPMDSPYEPIEIVDCGEINVL